MLNSAYLLKTWFWSRSGHSVLVCHTVDITKSKTDLCWVAGVNLLQESNLVAGILLNGMFLLGTFTFAVVLGVVSDDISNEVKVSQTWQW